MKKLFKRVALSIAFAVMGAFALPMLSGADEIACAKQGEISTKMPPRYLCPNHGTVSELVDTDVEITHTVVGDFKIITCIYQCPRGHKFGIQFDANSPI